MTNDLDKIPPLEEQIARFLGPLKTDQLTQIMGLSPKLLDVEEAAVCLAGDRDVLAKSAHHVSATAEKIVEILRANEETSSGEG